MTEQMPRPTPEEAERLKQQGIFDAGISYLRLGWTRKRKYKFWDGYVPPEDRAEQTEPDGE